MAVAIQRVQVGTSSIPVVITAAKAVDGTLTLRIENQAGANDYPMTQGAMLALAAALTAVANA